MSWDTLIETGLLEAPPTQEQIDDAGLSDEDHRLLLDWWLPAIRATPTAVYNAPRGTTETRTTRRPREPAAPPAEGLDAGWASVQDAAEAAGQVKYSPDQPRDHGRFAEVEGSGGESTSAPSAGPSAQSTFKPQPTAHVRDAAAAFNAAKGLPPVRGGTYVEVDEPRAQSIAEAYDAMPSNDRSPETLAAYQALGREVEEQWRYAEDKMGMSLEAWTKDGQPYANSNEMRADVANNKHLYFFRGGEPHPYLGEVGADGLSANDKFRAVHDLFGHSAEGYGFGSRGEENAWLVHSQMFSPSAQRAMTSETRGQNSWVNFGKQNYNDDGSNKNIPATDKPYAEQKAGLLPEWASDWKAVLPKKAVRLDLDSLRRAQRRGVVYARKYRDDQPRDDHGRFSDGGGGIEGGGTITDTPSSGTAAGGNESPFSFSENEPRDFAAPPSSPNHLRDSLPEKFPVEQVWQAAPGALTPKQREMETRMREAIAADPRGMWARYQNIKDANGDNPTLNGKILATDLARELSDDYLADPSQSVAFQEPASWFINQAYAERLKQPPGPGEKPRVVFLAGGTGAGKTSGINDIDPKVLGEAQIIYDGNLASLNSGRERIEAAMAADKKVGITYVDRDPVASFRGMLERAEGSGRGRTVPLEAHIKTHVDARKTVQRLAQDYSGEDRVKFQYINNNLGGKGTARTVDRFDQLPLPRYTSLRSELHEELERAHREGRISDRTYRGVLNAPGP